MKTWNKDDEITYTHRGRHFELTLPRTWKSFHVKATWESSGNWALFRIFNQDDYPGITFGTRYLPLGIAGNWGGLIKWVSINEIVLSVSNGNGQGADGNFNWEVKVIC